LHLPFLTVGRRSAVKEHPGGSVLLSRTCSLSVVRPTNMTDKMSFDMDGNGTTEQIHRANTNPYPPPPSDRDANSAWLVPLGRADAGRGIDAGHGPSTLHQQIVSLPPPHPATRRSPWSTPTLMRHATIFPAWWAFPSAAAMGLNTALAEQTAGSQRVDKWTPRHKVRKAMQVPSFRALSGRLTFTAQRHQFNKDSLSVIRIPLQSRGGRP